MLTNITYLPLYRSFESAFDRDFLTPCYMESCKFDRASGYFSLRSLLLSIDGIIDYVKKKGQIRIVCSPQLSEEDIKAIERGISMSESKADEIITKEILEEYNFSPTELLKMDIICNMIAENRLQIKIAFMPNGIFHEKFGLFEDEEGNIVHYLGSNNETLSGSLNNMESFVVNESWEGKKDLDIIESQKKHFKSLWDNVNEDVAVIPFSEANKQDLFNKYKKTAGVGCAIYEYLKGTQQKIKKELYPYQERAIREFIENDGSHFYEMATGTGKTFTAVRTIKELKSYKDEKLFVVICVPQIELQNQWEQAVIDEGFKNIYLLGGNGANFDDTIGKATISHYIDEEDVICIAIYDTFFSKVWDRLGNISPVFVIVDEAHNLTPGNLDKLVALSADYKLGLSATIQRFCEEESDNVVKFFTPASTFYYGIDEAIEFGFLAKYEYHPIEVRLSTEDYDRFQSISKMLAIEMSKEEPDENKISNYRRERSLILKQCPEKLTKLREMTNDGYDFVNSVIYCGQGKDKEEISIIDNVSTILDKAGLIVSHFTSKTENRKKVLFDFENGFYDTLVAIKCFDEGVDVPKLDKIYIMASDSALRQTVQRRGRVLRQCKESGKTIAHIYDMIVLPPISAGTYGCESLIKVELDRAKEYNRLALNKDVNNIYFEEIETTYHILETNSDDNETELN